MDEYISKMLDAGLTPNVIYERAKAEFEKRQDQEKKKRIEKARKEMLAATANYVEALDPSLKISKEDLKEIEKTIVEIEEANIASRLHNTKGEDPIFNFLKTIGAM